MGISIISVYFIIGNEYIYNSTRQDIKYGYLLYQSILRYRKHNTIIKFKIVQLYTFYVVYNCLPQ